VAVAAAGRKLTLIYPSDINGDAGPKAFIHRYFRARHLDLAQRISLYSVIGLPLLCASTYFLAPPHEPIGAHLLLSLDLFWLIILSSLVAVVAWSSVLYVISVAGRFAAARHILRPAKTGGPCGA
jgi:hypothetical protein